MMLGHDLHAPVRGWRDRTTEHQPFSSSKYTSLLGRVTSNAVPNTQHVPRGDETLNIEVLFPPPLE